MFEYCQARHVDPSYEYMGSTDYALLDMESRTVLLYSTEYRGGEFIRATLVPPMKFEEFIGINRIKGKTLKELFAKADKLKSMKVRTKCIRVEKEALMPIILGDLSDLPEDARSKLEAIIAESF